MEHVTGSTYRASCRRIFQSSAWFLWKNYQSTFIRSCSSSSEASRLYSLFLEPLEDVMTTEKITTVLVSADRGLQAIPFSALARQGQYAVENLSFSFTPSLSLTDLSIPLANSELDRILIMGSTQFSELSPLPYVNQEVENIGQYYGGQSVLGEQFTSSRAVSDLRSSNESLIHLATHADFKGGKS